MVIAIVNISVCPGWYKSLAARQEGPFSAAMLRAHRGWRGGSGPLMVKPG
jgi:hypothetical protein